MMEISSVVFGALARLPFLLVLLSYRRTQKRENDELVVEFLSVLEGSMNEKNEIYLVATSSWSQLNNFHQDEQSVENHGR